MRSAFPIIGCKWVVCVTNVVSACSVVPKPNYQFFASSTSPRILPCVIGGDFHAKSENVTLSFFTVFNSGRFFESDLKIKLRPVQRFAGASSGSWNQAALAGGWPGFSYTFPLPWPVCPWRPALPNDLLSFYFPAWHPIARS